MYDANWFGCCERNSPSKYYNLEPPRGGVQMNIDDVSYCDTVCFAVPVLFVVFLFQ